MKTTEEVKPQVVSDKEEVASAQNTIKVNQVNNQIQIGVDNTGKCIAECPIIPIGNQIFLEYNLIEKGQVGPNGLITAEDRPIFPYPKVIGIGGSVKTVNIGDRICIKADSAKAMTSYEEHLSGFKFHVIFETSILGIYTGPVKIEEDPKKIIIKKDDKPNIIV